MFESFTIHDLPTRTLSEDEVLRVLIEVGCCGLDISPEEAEDEGLADWSIRDWGMGVNDLTLRPYRVIVGALESAFQISLNEEQWRAILQPIRRRTVREVARSLAEVAVVPSIPEPRVLGLRCRKAGAFLLIRALLKAGGASVGSLRPSSLLSDFSRGGLVHLLPLLGRIAPRVMEKFRIESRYGLDGLLLLATALTAIVGSFVAVILARESPMAGVLSLVVGVVTMRLLWLKSREIWRADNLVVHADGLNTFRDLSIALAAEAR